MTTLDASVLVKAFGAFAGQAITYFAIVGATFWVVWKWAGPGLLRSRRIQQRVRFDRAQLKHELKHSLMTLAAGSGSAILVGVLHASGQTKLSNDFASFGWPTLIATFFIILICNDAWFYVCHRALHHPFLFRHVHSVHHKSVDVNPFSSYSFHFVEGALLGGWIVPFVVLVPTYLPLLGVLQVVGLANNINAHLGYELFPRWMVRVPPFRWLTSSTYHNLHHSRLRGNYGLMFRWIGRVLGTEVPEYEQVFLHITAPSDARARGNP